MVTIDELAKICNVSVATVSKAINGYPDISEKTRNNILNKANEIGYFPNASARALKSKKSYNIGVLFSTHTNIGLRNDYFSYILSAFKDEAAQNGYDITFIENYIGKRKHTYLEHCQFRNFDGVCIVCADYDSQDIIGLVNSDIPVITIDYVFDNAFSVISDNYDGMRQLTKYLISQGHTDIAMLHGVMTFVTKCRINGFKDTMKESGFNVPDGYILESGYRNILKTEEVVLKLLQLPNRPTCIITPDDQAALGAISAIRSQGLKLAEDISITGYDGNDLNDFIDTKLTTVKQERDEIGKTAALKLVEMIENKDDVQYGVQLQKQTLIIGNTVKKLN